MEFETFDEVKAEASLAMGCFARIRSAKPGNRSTRRDRPCLDRQTPLPDRTYSCTVSKT
ncbi:hypothetical protein ACT4MK_02260 (plasmid) [Bradyrhizobium barranii]|uniref:hypothetical protein n=1 Tax=Bradyrhizobium TaxID=374 RepID=UPI003F272E9D